MRPEHKTHPWDKVDKLEAGRTPLDRRMELNRDFLVQSREDAQGLITYDRANKAVFPSSLRRQNDEDSERMLRGHQPEKPAFVCGPVHIWPLQKNSLAGQPAGTASGEQGSRAGAGSRGLSGPRTLLHFPGLRPGANRDRQDNLVEWGLVVFLCVVPVFKHFTSISH